MKMKRIVSLLLAAVLLLCALTSCSIEDARRDNTLADRIAIAIRNLSDSAKGPADVSDYDWYKGYDYEFSYSEKEEKALSDAIDGLYAIVHGENLQPIRLANALNRFSKQWYRLLDEYYLATIAFYRDMSDEKGIADYKYINDCYGRYQPLVQGLESEFYDSIYREFYFGTEISEEEEALLTARKENADEIAGITARVNEITVEYEMLDPTAEDYMDESAELYLEAVRLNTDLARLLGYENYADYAYGQVFGREYTPADAVAIHENVREHIAPTMVAIAQRMTGSDITEERLAHLAEPLTLNFLSGEARSYYEPYFRRVGSTLLKAYDNFLTRRDYLSANNENAMEAAFTASLPGRGISLCYFGPGEYSDTMTFIHEFGHYYGFYADSFVNARSNDMLEIHSQGNEFLYLAYVAALERDGVTKEETDYLVDAQFLDSMTAMAVATLVDEFEQKVYKNADTLEADDFDQWIVELGREYFPNGFFDEIGPSYWRKVTVRQPCYYISYAVSLVPSYGIYLKAEEDFGLGARVYLRTVNAGDTSFLTALAQAGLGSPFDGETYLALEERFA